MQRTRCNFPSSKIFVASIPLIFDEFEVRHGNYNRLIKEATSNARLWSSKGSIHLSANHELPSLIESNMEFLWPLSSTEDVGSLLSEIKIMFYIASLTTTRYLAFVSVLNEAFIL